MEKHQLVVNVFGDFVNGIFSQENPITSNISETLTKRLEDAMKGK